MDKELSSRLAHKSAVRAIERRERTAARSLLRQNGIDGEDTEVYKYYSSYDIDGGQKKLDGLLADREVFKGFESAVGIGQSLEQPIYGDSGEEIYFSDYFKNYRKELYSDGADGRKAALDSVNPEEEIKKLEKELGFARAAQAYGLSDNADWDIHSVGTSASDKAMKKERLGKYLTEDEKSRYRYLYNTEGADAASSYMFGMSDTLKQRQSKALYDFADEHKIVGSAASVGTNLLSSAEWLTKQTKWFMNAGLSESEAINASRYTEALRSGASSDFGNVGRFFYSTAMSGVDSYAASLIPAGALLLGASAAASGMNDALSRGATSEQAAASGLAAGTFEMLFESVSVGNIKSTRKYLESLDPKDLKNIVGRTAASVGINASEEAATEIANIVFDTLYMGGLSNAELAIKEYKAAGMTESEAHRKVFGELGAQVGEAALSGGLMGGAFTAIGVGEYRLEDAIRSAKFYTAEGKEIRSLSDAEAAIEAYADAAKSYGTDTAAYKSAERYEKKPRSNYRLGRLANDVAREAYAKAPKWQEQKTKIAEEAAADVSNTVEKAEKEAKTVPVGDVISYENILPIYDFGGTESEQIIIKKADGTTSSLAETPTADAELAEVYILAAATGSVENANRFVSNYALYGADMSPALFWSGWIGAQNYGQAVVREGALEEALKRYEKYGLNENALKAAFLAGRALRSAGKSEKSAARTEARSKRRGEEGAKNAKLSESTEKHGIVKQEVAENGTFGRNSLRQLRSYGNTEKISKDMSDRERYELLNKRKIKLSAHSDINKLETVLKSLNMTKGNIELSKYGDRVRLFKKLGEEFSVFGHYFNGDVKLDFQFSKENMRESVSKQRRNYINLAKMLTCFDAIIENAVGIEVHNRNSEGYKSDGTPENVYVLASAFCDKNSIVPVKLEVKEFSDKANTLHVAIALESMEKDGIVKQEVAETGVARQYSPPSYISIPEYFKKIKSEDESFYKYIPEQYKEDGKNEVSHAAVSDSSVRKRANYAKFDDGALKGKQLDVSQKDYAAFLRAFSEALGVNVTVEYSEKGKRGENGSYDRSTNTIYVDINAGIGNGADYSAEKSAVIHTLAHETVHAMAATAPEQYYVLRDAALELLERDVSYDLDEAVEAVLESYAERGRRLSREEAMEELVARACEDRLASSETLSELMTELNSRDGRASRSFTEAVRELLTRIAKFFERMLKLKSRSAEAMAAASAGAELVSELQARFDGALLAVREENGAGTKKESGAQLNLQLYEWLETVNAELSDNSITQSGKDVNGFSEKKYSNRQSDFEEDKYYAPSVDKWKTARHGGYLKVGRLYEDSPLCKVGIPAGILGYGVDKLKRNMSKHADYLTEELLKQIPNIISDPIAISEYGSENTVSVFGDIFVGGSPIMVGVTVSRDRVGNEIPKVRTLNVRRDVGKLITDDTVLYLCENKKRTRKWFQACGILVPLGGTQYGFIRSISQSGKNVNGFSEKKSSDVSVSRQNDEKEKRTREQLQACGIQVPLGGAHHEFTHSISQDGKDVNGFSEKKSAEATKIFADVRYSERESLADAAENMETVSDADYLKQKGRFPFVLVAEHTPQKIVSSIEGGRDRRILMRRDALYLAVRKDGVQDGHYHGLGSDVMKELPKYLADPDVIISTVDRETGEESQNRRLILTHTDGANGQGIISVEFETIKTFDDNKEYFNVVVTAFDLHKNYLAQLFKKHGATVKYRKESLAQSNLQLYEWLEIINAKLSDNIIPQNEEDVNSFSEKIYSERTEAPDASDVLKNLFSDDGAYGGYREYVEGLKKYAKMSENVEFWEAEADKLDTQISRLRSERRQSGKGSRMDELYRRRTAAEEKAEKYRRRMLEMETGELRRVVDAETKKAVLSAQKAERSKYAAKSRVRTENAARRHYIDGIGRRASEMSELLLKNTAAKHIPDPLKKPVAELISAIDFSSRRSLGGGEQTKKELAMKNAVLGVRELLTRLEGEDGAAGFTLDLPTSFSEEWARLEREVYGLTSIKDGMPADGAVLELMDVSALRALNRSMRMLSHAISEANSLVANARFASAADAAEKCIAAWDKMPRRDSAGERHAVRDFFDFDNTTPEYFFERLGSDAATVFGAFKDGQDTLALDMDKIIRFAEETYTGAEVKEWGKKIRRFEVNGKEIFMTEAQIMSLYALEKRSQARKHLYAGGVKVDAVGADAVRKLAGEKDKRRGASDVAAGFVPTAEDVARITGTLTDRQREVADSLRRFMAQVGGAWGDEIHMKRYGIGLSGDADYFPIETGRGHGAGGGTRSLLNISSLNSVSDRANGRIVIRDIFDVFSEHMSDMASYHSLALPLLDLMKWYNYSYETEGNNGAPSEKKTLRASLEAAYGRGAVRYIDGFIRDVNGAAAVGRGGAFSKNMISNYKMAHVAGNLRVALLQPTSLWRALNVLDAGDIGSAVLQPEKIIRAYKKAKENCPMVLWKAMGFHSLDTATPLKTQIKQSQTVKGKIAEATMKGAEWGDDLTVGLLWLACERRIKKERPTLEYNSAEFKRYTAALLRDVIYKTQVVDSVLTRSEFMRSESGTAQVFGAFMAEPTLAYNTVQSAFVKLTDKRRAGGKIGIKSFARTMAKPVLVFCLSAVAQAVVEALPDAMRDDGGDRELYEKYLDGLFENVLSELDPVNKLPIVKEFSALLSIIANRVLGTELGVYYSNKMDTAFIKSIGSAMTGLFKIIDGDTDSVMKTVYAVLKAMSELTGLPFSNLLREVLTMWNTLAFEIDDSYVIEY